MHGLRLAARWVLVISLLTRPVAAQEGAAQEGAVLSGRVLSAATSEPVPDVILRIGGTDVSAVSGADGRFTLRGLPAGEHTLQVRHGSVGTREMRIAVRRPGENFEVVVHLGTEGFSVDVLEATGSPPPPPPTASPIPVSVTEGVGDVTLTPSTGSYLNRARIQELARASQNLGDVIRRGLPALRVRQMENTPGSPLCFEFRGTGARTMQALSEAGVACSHPVFYLDGVVVQDPNLVYNMTGLQGIEWIQALPPGEAGAQFGSAPYGVLLVATTAGGSAFANPSFRAFATRRSRTFDWAQDGNGHPFLKAFLGAAAGNAIGLAAGLAAGRECIYVDDRTKELERSCSQAGVAGVGLVAFSLPAFGSAMGARLGGGTDTSVGKLIPALVGASMAIFPGYALSLSTVGDGVEQMNAVGKGFLIVGTPLLTTLADRLYRKLRND